MTAAPKRKARFSSIKRLAGFLKILRTNKRGLLGVIVLILFVGIALGAPLLTPYEPVWQTYLAGDYAKPVWFRYLPGGENLTENLEPILHPGFPTATSLQEWNFTKTTSSATVELRYDPIMGTEGENYGCVAIDFGRAAGTYADEVKTVLTKRFYYPFSGSPTRFKCQVTVMTEGAENLERIDIRISLKRLGENTTVYPLWVYSISKDKPSWIVPVPEIDSYASKLWVRQYFGSEMIDPAKEVFNASYAPANFEYVVEVDFFDSKHGMLYKDIKATVYVDDLNIKIYGDTFGPLGTDYLGRDIFTQLIYGARLSLTVGLLSALLSVFIGLLVGLVAGYLGKIADEIIMRITDMLLVIPGLPLLIVLVAVLGPSLWSLVILIGVLGWMGFARVVRAQVLSLRERPFVEAAKAVGAGKLHIMAKHILPNVMSLVYVSLALSVPTAILSEAALSWLGLYDPNVMSWGRMLFDVQNNHGVERWWWVMPPGLCIAVVSLSFILIGYALDEILNPKLRVRR